MNDRSEEAEQEALFVHCMDGECLRIDTVDDR